MPGAPGGLDAGPSWNVAGARNAADVVTARRAECAAVDARLREPAGVVAGPSPVSVSAGAQSMAAADVARRRRAASITRAFFSAASRARMASRSRYSWSKRAAAASFAAAA